MTTVPAVATLPRALNHVELVHAPGERALAAEVFELIGCGVRDSGGTFLTAVVEPGAPASSNNVLYVSEVTPEQWAMEEALRASLGAEGPLQEATEAYLARLKREPQRSFHFGIRCEDRDRFEERLAAVRAVPETHPHLAGRIAVSGVFFPGDPGAYTDRMAQGFLWTDVIASGLLSLGQHIELQWHLPRD